MVFISTYGKILYQTKFCFHFICEKWSTYLLKWFKLSLLGMLWSYNFSWQTLVLLLYYTRVQITAILLWDSTIVPIICNIEQEVYVHQHLSRDLHIFEKIILMLPDYWLRWGEDLTSILTSLFLRGLRWGSSISFDARNEVRSSIFLWGWGKKSSLTFPQFKHEKCWKN